MATRLATFAMVPVKRLWMAVKPVSNGEPPCARAATGMRKTKTRIAAVGRAHFDRRRGWTWRIRWTWNQRGDICASGQQPKIAACGAKLTRTQSRCPITLLLDIMLVGYESGNLASFSRSTDSRFRQREIRSALQ